MGGFLSPLSLRASLLATALLLPLAVAASSVVADFEQADVVFIGYASSIKASPDFTRTDIHFSVEKSWKKNVGNDLDVFTVVGNGNCRTEFTIDGEYLVYGKQGSDGIFVSTCSGTKPRSEADADILYMNAKTEPDQFMLWDVPTTHPNYDAIRSLFAENIVQGYPDWTFRPDQVINRAEFAKIIIGARFTADEINECIDRQGRTGTILPADVPATSWFAPYVCRAIESGIISGYPDGKFRPDRTINFAEAAKILSISFAGPDFSQTDQQWFRPYVKALDGQHAIPPSIAAFDQSITRGEMAEMIYRLKNGIMDKPGMSYILLSEGQPNVEWETIDYVLRYRYETNPEASDLWDASLIEINKDGGKETVLVQSIKQAVPALRAKQNLSLQIFARPQGTPLLITKEALMETDNASGKLYAFDAKSRTFRLMQVNEIYDGFYGGFAMSPDQERFVWVPNPENGNAQTMYLIDLQHDSSTMLVHLTGNESFNAGDFALASEFDIAWPGQEQVRYAVFDRSRMNSDGQATLIEHRTVWPFAD